MATKHSIRAQSVSHLLDRWDEGLPIVTVSMGGMSPHYELIIQTLAIELVRRFEDEEVPPRRSFIEGDRDFREWGDEELGEIIVEQDIHPSAAQHGAAKNLAYRILVDGVEHALESAPEDRLLTMDKDLDTYEKA